MRFLDRMVSVKRTIMRDIVDNRLGDLLAFAAAIRPRLKGDS
jgi:hypothetical protein